jgi:putative phage-type endonuclease
MKQRSDEWFAARCGKVTASRVPDIIATTKSGYSASRKNYAAQIVVERLTGKPADNFQSDAMKWGIDKEPEARAVYEIVRKVSVEETGLVVHPAIPMSGASPDGLVGEEGQIEIKCPNTAQHIETLISQAVPEKYLTQMNWQMACTGRQWTDFVSFDPRMPPHLRLFIRRVERDKPHIAFLEEQVKLFLAEIDKTLAGLEALRAK